MPGGAAITASVAGGLLTAATAYILAGSRAVLFTGVLWAVVPVNVAAGTFYPDKVYGVGAAAAALFFFAAARERDRPHRPALIGAGVAAGVAGAVNAQILALPAYLLAVDLVNLIRKTAPRRARLLIWFPAFALTTGVANAFKYVRTGELITRFGPLTTGELPPKTTLNEIVKRLISDAAAMVLWDPRAFGGLIVLASVGAAFLWKDTRVRFFAGALIFFASVFNFAPQRVVPYVPTVLEPERWILLIVPAVILAAVALSRLPTADAQTIKQWAGFYGLACVLSVLFFNGSVPGALRELVSRLIATVAALAAAGWAGRHPVHSGVAAKIAAATALLITPVPLFILYA